MGLLTRNEYKAIAANLSLTGCAFVDGGFRPAASGATFESVNPATGEKLADIADCDATDIDFAVAKAREAFDGRPLVKGASIRTEGCSHRSLQVPDTRVA